MQDTFTDKDLGGHEMVFYSSDLRDVAVFLPRLSDSLEDLLLSPRTHNNRQSYSTFGYGEDPIGLSRVSLEWHDPELPRMTKYAVFKYELGFSTIHEPVLLSRDETRRLWAKFDLLNVFWIDLPYFYHKSKFWFEVFRGKELVLMVVEDVVIRIPGLDFRDLGDSGVERKSRI